MTITRRDMIKAGAIAGGLAWTAPVIESFTTKAAAASVQPNQHACCACFDSKGTFIAAAADDFTDAGCEFACARATSTAVAGTFLRFAAVDSFVAAGVTETNPGCSYKGTFLDGLAGSGPQTCPPQVELPGGVTCDHGTWTAA